MSTTLVVFALLLPFFFVPGATFPFQFSKVFLALIAIALMLIAFSIRTLRSGTLVMRWSWLSVALLALPATYLISAVFSSVPSLSFFGYQIDQDTFGFMALCAALALATSIAADSEGKVHKVLSALFYGAAVVVVFQLIQILFGVPLTFGLFNSPIQNLLGKWNDLALFASLLGSLSLFAMEALPLANRKKIFLGVAVVFSVTLLAFAGFSLAWILFGIAAFMLLVFSFMRRHLSGGETAPQGTNGVAPIIALVVVIFFLFFGSGASNALQSRFAISALEVSPSAQGTLGILESVYSKNPLLGSGPNTFANAWLVARPAETLSTVFWATEFNNGFGYIPTAVATGGVVVALGWLGLIGLFLLTVFRGLVTVPNTGGRSYFLAIATAFGSAFLLAAHLFYNPSQSLTLLLFLFLGLCIASLSAPVSRSLSISFSERPRIGFVSVVAIAVIMVFSLVSAYTAGVVYVSAVIEGKSIVRSNAGDLPGALAFARQAVTLAPQDRYLRTLAGLQLASLNQLVQSGKNDAATQKAFQDGLSQAVSTAAAATAINPLSYDNWMARASVYEAVVPLKIAGAAENAIAALETARKLNPASPEVNYQEASLKAFAKDTVGAKKSAAAAIALKADYTPAILLLAQLSLNEGNLDEAIASLRSAIVFNPNASSLFYELGLLQLQSKRYQEAADAFSQALTITPAYANASFFLGQADVFLGKKDEALALFAALQKDNPDNATLKDVIAQIGRGVNPFAKGTSLPPDSTPKQGQ